jgi:hypothetical protein
MPQEKLYGLIADFLISKWLLLVCFFELHLHGLTTNFFLGTNCKENLKLLSKVRDRFRLEALTLFYIYR